MPMIFSKDRGLDPEAAFSSGTVELQTRKASVLTPR